MLKRYQLFILFLLILVSFVGINIAVSLLSTQFVADTTQNKIYSLSHRTKEWLNNNKNNIFIRLYVSEDGKEYAQEVLRLLEQYRTYSNGKISIKTIDVEPLSAAEAEAQKLNVIKRENNIYLGLVISDQNGYFETIPYINPLRKAYWEHDISRLLSKIKTKDKSIIGVLNTEVKTVITDNSLDYATDWPVWANLRRDYDIRYVKSNSVFIDNEIDVLVVVNPKELSYKTIYAIDQYLMHGGNILIFLDPVSEVAVAEKNYVPKDSSMEELLENFGLKYNYNKVAADMKSNRLITKADGSKYEYPFWINVLSQNNDNVLTRDLQVLLLNSSGYLEITPQDGVVTSTLLSTSEESGIGNINDVLFNSINESIKNIQRYNNPLPLAVLLEGKFNSMYAEPVLDIPLYLTGEYAFQSIMVKPGKILVVTDTDLLNSRLWNANTIDNQEWYDFVPYSNNFDFVERAIDYMSDSSLLSVAPKYSVYNMVPFENSLLGMIKKFYSQEIGAIDKEIAEVEKEQQELTQKIKKQEILMSIPVAQKMQNLEKKRIDLTEKQKMIQQKTDYTFNAVMIMFVIVNLILPILFLVGIMLLFRKHSTKIKLKAERIINECK